MPLDNKWQDRQKITDYDYPAERDGTNKPLITLTEIVCIAIDTSTPEPWSIT
ncbi:hypothetical protein NTGM5_280011 [Candidatus Nitrotoga sp. M5]|nr:hypothetical protein NTGM5_280011 [Candidatus Nitrotoga sp. M5]